jgi:hypothetical protein
MFRLIFYIFLFNLLVFNGNAQNKFVLSGHVIDAATGEDLPGATVIVEGISNTGTTTNPYGFYSLTLPAGKHAVRYQYVGYKNQEFEIELLKNTVLDVELIEKTYELGNIVVTGEAPDRNVSSVEMGNIKMSPKEVEKIPVIFGEQDIVKTMQLTPGVKSAGEGNSGFYVRGGGIDQNLILLDEAPVYNASHLLGFFSIFNSEAIRDANLMKGSIPAEYGGRASSVFDIKMKEGNLKEYGVAGSIGLISSNLAFEGPIVKDKGSFIVSARRTYADVFLMFSKKEDLKDTKLYFYDLNLKANYKINSNNRIYLSGYFGRDDFGFADEFGFDWGNATGTVRWNHNFSEKLFSNTSFIVSNYSYDINILGDVNIVIGSQINDINLKQDFTYYLNSRNTLKFGGNAIYHNIMPGEIKVIGNSSINPETITTRKAIEWAAYVSNSQSISERLKIYYGLRLALFSNVGPGEFYEFDENGDLNNTTEINSFEFVKTQGGLEPRLALNYMISSKSSFKTSYNRIYQFLHLLSNSTTTTPTDLWLPSSNNVKPQIADQISAGYFRNFKNNEYESSFEVYYKDLKNQIDYKNGANLVFNSTVEAELVFGRGWAYGAEFMFKRNFGRLNGWVSYTWSRTMRQFDEINNGNAFPARQDRIHDLALVGIYELAPKWSLSANWVYNTGNAVTFPNGKYEIDGLIAGYYTQRNGYRMPPYHRLDIGLTWQRKKTEKFESSWNFSVYNVYARENAYFIQFRQNEDNPAITEAVQFAIFKAIPSVSYRFKF